MFLPMAYFTARARTTAGIAAYAAANIRYIRGEAGAQFPIHPIGGEALHATPAQIATFRAATSACRVVGTSLWEYGQMTHGRWDALLREPVAPGRC